MSVTSPDGARPAIRLSELTIRRGPRLVVDGLDLAIEVGRIVWIVGPNGAGKSSLLRVVAGLDAPTAGSVRYTGPPQARPGYAHSEMRIPGGARVVDWERLARQLSGDPGAPAERTALWPQVGETRRVGRLSTGERKRLLLDVLLRRPRSLILDEPLEHLSPDAKTTLVRLLTARARDHLVIVATNQQVAQARRDGALYLEGGRAEPLAPSDGDAP